MAYLNERVIVFDFETSGLSAEKHQPIEMAAKSLEVDGSTREFSCLVHCPEKLSDKIIEITGLTDHDLEQNGIDYLDAFTQLAKFIGYDQDNVSPYLVGHNWIKFDAHFLVKGLKVVGVDPIPDSKGWDTAGQYKADKLKLKRNREEKILKYHLRALNTFAKGLYYNLTACCLEYKIEAKGTHRAMADVEMTLRCYLKQVDEYGQTNYLQQYLENYEKIRTTAGSPGEIKSESVGTANTPGNESPVQAESTDTVPVDE